MQVVELGNQNWYIPCNMTGTELKKWRENLDFSQQKLSQLLELSLSTVARWEQLEDKDIPNGKLLSLALETVERNIKSDNLAIES